MLKTSLFTNSRLEYCKSLLSGCPQSFLESLQLIQRVYWQGLGSENVFIPYWIPFNGSLLNPQSNSESFSSYSKSWIIIRWLYCSGSSFLWLNVWHPDQQILRELERKRILVFTPSRRYAGKRVVCNDDCYIVKHAFESDGIIVSNDMYRDLQGEKPEWKRFIEERLLMYSFVNNKWVLRSWYTRSLPASNLD